MIRVLLTLLGLLLACDGERANAPPLPPLPPVVEAPAPVATGERLPLKEIVIAVTGEVRGEIEPCGCPTVPYGGFPRRLRAIERLRAEGLPVFVLDAGDMLVKGVPTRASPDGVRRAGVVLGLARMTGLDAWAASPLDLRPAGLSLLRGTQALAAGWTDPAGQPVLPGSRIIERGGVRLGVIGLPGREDLPDGVVGGEAVAATRAALVGEADAWVVLSNASSIDAEAVAAGVPGIGVVVGLRGERLDKPRSTPGAPIVEVPDRGRFLTVLRVAVATRPGPFTLVEGGTPERLAHERERAAALPAGTSKDGAEAQVARLRAALEAEAAGRALLFVEQRPLGSDLDGDPASAAMEASIRTFKGDTLGAAAARATQPSTGPRYATAGACFRCHSERFAAWSVTPHARAHEALLQRGKDQDTECVGCHTTGFGAPGGYATLTDRTMDTWKGVQCEACHGPMGGHPQDGKVHSVGIAGDTCLACHDPANSPDFDYARYLPKVSCVSVSKQEAAARTEGGR